MVPVRSHLKASLRTGCSPLWSHTGLLFFFLSYCITLYEPHHNCWEFEHQPPLPILSLRLSKSHIFLSARRTITLLGLLPHPAPRKSPGVVGFGIFTYLKIPHGQQHHFLSGRPQSRAGPLQVINTLFSRWAVVGVLLSLDRPLFSSGVPLAGLFILNFGEATTSCLQRQDDFFPTPFFFSFPFLVLLEPETAQLSCLSLPAPLRSQGLRFASSSFRDNITTRKETTRLVWYSSFHVLSGAFHSSAFDYIWLWVVLLMLLDQCSDGLFPFSFNPSRSPVLTFSSFIQKHKHFGKTYSLFISPDPPPASHPPNHFGRSGFDAHLSPRPVPF